MYFLRAQLPRLLLLSLAGCSNVLGLGDFFVAEGGSQSGGSATGGSNSGGASSGGSNSGAASSNGGGDPNGGAANGGSANVGGGGGGDPCLNPTTYVDTVDCDEPMVYLRFDDGLGSIHAANQGWLASVPSVSCAAAAGFYDTGVPAIGGSALRLPSGASCQAPAEPLLDFIPFEPFTIEAWVQGPQATVDSFGYIGTWDGTAGYSLFFFPRYEPLGYLPNTEFKRNAVPNIIQCSEFAGCQDMFGFALWRHIVATYGGADNQASLYINGELIGTKTLANDLLDSANPLSLVGPADYFVFDEVAIYDYPLTSAQVLVHYQCGSGQGC